MLQTPTSCECGNDTFKVELLDGGADGYDDVIIGILYECTKCGYIHTAWRD